LVADFDTPRIATSGALTMGVNAVPPMPPSELMVKQPPCMSAGLELAVARLLGQRRPSPGDLQHPFWSASLITGTTKAVRRVGREADVEVRFRIRLSPSSEALNSGKLLQRGYAALIRKASMVSLVAGLGVFLVELRRGRLPGR
jgi:hypothetical protein